MNIFLELHVPSSRLYRCPVSDVWKGDLSTQGLEKGDQPNDGQGQKVGQGHFNQPRRDTLNGGETSQHPTKSLKQTKEVRQKSWF